MRVISCALNNQLVCFSIEDYKFADTMNIHNKVDNFIINIICSTYNYLINKNFYNISKIHNNIHFLLEDISKNSVNYIKIILDSFSSYKNEDILAEIISKKMELLIHNIKEALDRIYDDNEIISKIFFPDSEENSNKKISLTKIMMKDSDPHRKGKIVFCFELSINNIDKTIIYKPSSVLIDFLLLCDFKKIDSLSLREKIKNNYGEYLNKSLFELINDVLCENNMYAKISTYLIYPMKKNNNEYGYIEYISHLNRSNLKKHKIFLMASPNDEKYEKSNQDCLFLYKDKTGDIYYLYDNEENKTTKFLIDNALLKNEIFDQLLTKNINNPYEYCDDEKCDAILEITSKRNHTRKISLPNNLVIEAGLIAAMAWLTGMNDAHSENVLLSKNFSIYLLYLIDLENSFMPNTNIIKTMLFDIQNGGLNFLKNFSTPKEEHVKIFLQALQCVLSEKFIKIALEWLKQPLLENVHVRVVPLKTQDFINKGKLLIGKKLQNIPISSIKPGELKIPYEDQDKQKDSEKYIENKNYPISDNGIPAIVYHTPSTLNYNARILINDLLQGDIPIYYINFNSTILLNSLGEAVKTYDDSESFRYFIQSPFQAAMSKCELIKNNLKYRDIIIKSIKYNFQTFLNSKLKKQREQIDDLVSFLYLLSNLKRLLYVDDKYYFNERKLVNLLEMNLSKNILLIFELIENFLNSRSEKSLSEINRKIEMTRIIKKIFEGNFKAYSFENSIYYDDLCDRLEEDDENEKIVLEELEGIKREVNNELKSILYTININDDGDQALYKANNFFFKSHMYSENIYMKLVDEEKNKQYQYVGFFSSKNSSLDASPNDQTLLRHTAPTHQ